jgi:hypothetical protein
LAIKQNRTDTFFRGIALGFIENQGYVLHICPGDRPFSAREYQEMMQEVTQKLAKQQITVKAYVVDGERSGISSKRFQEWQKLFS